VQQSLFEVVYVEDLNPLERQFACYLDEQQALRWWFRNVAKAMYGIQGWKRNRVYPDFVFALERGAGDDKLVVLETKGDHLQGPDTTYKRELLDHLTENYETEKLDQCGTVEIVTNDGRVECALVFGSDWKAELHQTIQRANSLT